uniref:Putative secreted protein n=1 Tax=Anopheles triannulatus TaxID=58253 RepID=A0A2M4B7E8_9DIPT
MCLWFFAMSPSRRTTHEFTACLVTAHRATAQSHRSLLHTDVLLSPLVTAAVSVGGLENADVNQHISGRRFCDHYRRQL